MLPLTRQEFILSLFCIIKNMRDKDVNPFYRTERWKRIRESVLRRDGYMCQISRRYGKAVQADTVHHIFPLEDYPQYAYEKWNLISLSTSAHNRLHNRVTNELTAEGKNLQEKLARKRGILIADTADKNAR